MEQKDIDQEIANFLPRKVTVQWLEKMGGKSRWPYDTDALTYAITKPALDLISRGGKRWRPKLLILACKAVGGREEEALKFAVIPELIHTGTLIIDDIEDSSAKRRGLPAIHLLYGVPAALNAGNALYFLPLRIISNSDLPDNTKIKLYETINEELTKVHFGQGTDIYWSNSEESAPAPDEYLQMCANKTGVLARMAAKIGAMIGGGTENQIAALGKFGESLGVAFQIQDDILNIASKDLGKEYGEDIKEGKLTLMVIQALRKSSNAERLREILKKKTSSKNLIEEAIRLLVDCGSIDYAKSVARDLIADAESTLKDELSESNALNELFSLSQKILSKIK